MTVRGQFPGQGRFTRDDNGRHRFRPMQTTITTVEGTVEAQNSNLLQIEYFWQDDFFAYGKILSTSATATVAATHDLTPAEGKILSTGASPIVTATREASSASTGVFGVINTSTVSHDAALTSPAGFGTIGTAEVTPASNFAAASIGAAAMVPVATATADRTPVEGKILSTGASPSATASHSVAGVALGDVGATAAATISAATDFAATSIGATAATAQAAATTERTATAAVGFGESVTADMTRSTSATVQASTGTGFFATVVRSVTGFVQAVFGAIVTAIGNAIVPAEPLPGVLQRHIEPAPAAMTEPSAQRYVDPTAATVTDPKPLVFSEGA